MPELAGNELSTRLFEFAKILAAETGANAIIISADVFQSCESLAVLIEKTDLPVILATQKRQKYAGCAVNENRVLNLPPTQLTRSAQVKMAVLLALVEGLIQQGSKVVCLGGTPDSGKLDLLMFSDTDGEFGTFASALAEAVGTIHSEVFERLLSIAVELAYEGREGKPVGTTFIIGDTEAVIKHSEQMIFNPFFGYPAEERNVLDPRLTETIKEFAMIDGAFIVTSDGYVERAGSYLRPNVSGEPLVRGLGTRHQSAAAMTAATQAIAITVSQSTGNVTVYHRGKMVIEIEKTHPSPGGKGAPSIDV